MIKGLIIGVIIGFVYRGIVGIVNEYYRKYKKMERFCKANGMKI